jgi:hypothetical protein
VKPPINLDAARADLRDLNAALAAIGECGTAANDTTVARVRDQLAAAVDEIAVSRRRLRAAAGVEDPCVLSAVTPAAVQTYLRERGWAPTEANAVVGTVIWDTTRPNGRRWAVLVDLDVAWSGYSESVRTAIRRLAMVEQRPAFEILADLLAIAETPGAITASPAREASHG